MIPLLIYKVLGQRKLKPTSVGLLMVDSYVKNPVGLLRDIKVRVVSFTNPIDFMILDCEVDAQALIIFGRPYYPLDGC